VACSADRIVGTDHAEVVDAVRADEPAPRSTKELERSNLLKRSNHVASTAPCQGPEEATGGVGVTTAFLITRANAPTAIIRLYCSGIEIR
jgi:hypothetical protein